METIMERYQDGKVVVGDQSFHVPKDRLALSILAINKIVDRSVYSIDGWVRVDGKRVKKWFTDIYAEGGGNPVRIWQPILKDVKALEARWWKMLCKRRKLVDEIWKPLYDAVVESGGAHAKITHKHNGEFGWWYYRKVGIYDLSFDWVKEPKEPMNWELGQRYYEADADMLRYGRYVWKFNVALTNAIYKEFLSKEPPDNPGSIWCITINGRDFLYLSRQAGAAKPFWQSVGWPDTADTMKVTILK